VGISDNFFDVGGDSLQAMRIVGLVRAAFHGDLPLKTIFETPTVENMAMHLSLRDEELFEKIPKIARGENISLSFSQQRLWFIDRYEEGSIHYNLPGSVRLKGELNAELFKKAVEVLLQRHEVLRTTFGEREGQSYQNIHTHFEVPYEYIDLSTLNEEAQEIEVSRLALSHSQRQFDLESELPIHFALIKLSDHAYIALFNMHHIASDGWSMAILQNELSILYQAFISGGDNPLPPLRIQYADFAIWQRELLSGELLARELEYWRGRLADLPVVHSLPLDRTRPVQQSYEGGIYLQLFDKSQAERMAAFCRSHNVTLFMFLMSALAVLLSRYSGEKDIVIGSPVAGRVHPDIEPLIGCFVNSLVIRSNLDGNPKFAEFLRQNSRYILDAYEHQNVQFEMLVDDLKPERSRSHSPLFQIMFILQNNEKGELNFSGLEFEEIASTSGIKFDLELNAVEHEQGINIGWHYNVALFDAVSIARFSESFSLLVEGVLQAPNEPIQSLQIVTETDKQKLLVEWNNTATPFPDDRCLHQLFEDQVLLSPTNTALVFEDKSLSYDELNRRSNQLAHHLVAQGVGPDVLVGLCLTRSLEMVIGIMGILKAGGAYVPMDPDFPEDRLRYMLEDTGIKLLLTLESLVANLSLFSNGNEAIEGLTVVCLDEPRTLDTLADYPQQNIDSAALALDASNLAYVIYTSGSTGKPKGVMTEHRSVVNRITWMQEQYPIESGDKVLQKTPYSFDVSVWELLWFSFTGAALVIAQAEGHKDPSYLREVVESQDISVIHFVPSMFSVFLQSIDNRACPSLRHIFCSGEALTVEQIMLFQSRGLSASLHNLYGPTEAAIDVSYWDCGNFHTGSNAPIGRPIANTQLYILDETTKIVPVGCVGELYIGGVGLARAYLNRPELTAKSFFVASPNGNDVRLYRTGDVARFLVDGNIEFMGRTDHQVKVRGLRIELGEIETTIASCTNVKEVVVVAKEIMGQSGSSLLLAYIVPVHQMDSSDEKREFSEAIFAVVRQKLPDYMVPNSFVYLEALPLSANGKLDRNALKVSDSYELGVVEYVAPRNTNEKILCGIWEELLQLDRVGIHDDFFSLGGDSLLSLRMISSAQIHGLIIRPKQIFEFKTIYGICYSIK
jgi:amino acid adenylation domain-containing protein